MRWRQYSCDSRTPSPLETPNREHRFSANVARAFAIISPARVASTFNVKRGAVVADLRDTLRMSSPHARRKLAYVLRSEWNVIDPNAR